MLRFLPLFLCIISLVLTAKGLRVGKVSVVELPEFGITCGAAVFALGLFLLVTAMFFRRKLKPHAMEYAWLLLLSASAAAMPGPLLYLTITADDSANSKLVILAFLSVTAAFCWPGNKGGKAPPPHTLR